MLCNVATGSFHMLTMFCDEYLSFLIERKASEVFKPIRLSSAPPSTHSPSQAPNSSGRADSSPNHEISSRNGQSILSEMAEMNRHAQQQIIMHNLGGRLEFGANSGEGKYITNLGKHLIPFSSPSITERPHKQMRIEHNNHHSRNEPSSPPPPSSGSSGQSLSSSSSSSSLNPGLSSSLPSSLPSPHAISAAGYPLSSPPPSSPPLPPASVHDHSLHRDVHTGGAADLMSHKHTTLPFPGGQSFLGLGLSGLGGRPSLAPGASFMAANGGMIQTASGYMMPRGGLGMSSFSIDPRERDRDATTPTTLPLPVQPIQSPYSKSSFGSFGSFSELSRSLSRHR